LSYKDVKLKYRILLIETYELVKIDITKYIAFVNTPKF